MTGCELTSQITSRRILCTTTRLVIPNLFGRRRWFVVEDSFGVNMITTGYFLFICVMSTYFLSTNEYFYFISFPLSNVDIFMLRFPAAAFWALPQQLVSPQCIIDSPQCIIDWGRAYKTVIQPMQVQQNRILKYMTFSNRTSSANNISKFLICTNLVWKSSCMSIMPISCPFSCSFFQNWTAYMIMAQDNKLQEIFIINMLELIMVEKCCNM